MTNPFHCKAGNFTPADVGNLSTSRLVAALAPGAQEVMALNNMIFPNLEADPVANGAKRVAFISALSKTSRVPSHSSPMQLISVAAVTSQFRQLTIPTARLE